MDIKKMTRWDWQGRYPFRKMRKSQEHYAHSKIKFYIYVSFTFFSMMDIKIFTNGAHGAGRVRVDFF